MGDTLAEIERAVQDAQAFAPLVAGAATMIPGASDWVKVAMAALTAFGNAVQIVQQNQGASPAQAVTAVLQHLTPGQPAAPALSESAPAQPQGA